MLISLRGASLLPYGAHFKPFNFGPAGSGMIRRVTFCGEVNTFTGFGQHSIAIMESLEKNGFFALLRPFTFHSDPSKRVPPWIIGRIVKSIQPELTEVTLSPIISERVPTVGKYTIYFTMWESTLLPKRFVQLLNSCQHVVVPCQWCRDTFVESGVKRPMEIVRLGYDPDVYKVSEQTFDGPFIFGAAGNLRNGVTRKGVLDVIEAFNLAFPKDKDVVLCIKCGDGDAVESLRDYRVHLCKTFMPEKRLAEWYRGINCFVSAARSEGFGLMQLQAMATGRPVIGTGYSGMAEFMSADNSFLLEYDLEDSQEAWLGCGQWARPRMDCLVETMRFVKSNPDRVLAKSIAAGNSVSGFTWDDVNKPLIELVSEYEKAGAKRNGEQLHGLQRAPVPCG